MDCMLFVLFVFLFQKLNTISNESKDSSTARTRENTAYNLQRTKTESKYEIQSKKKEENERKYIKYEKETKKLFFRSK